MLRLLFVTCSLRFRLSHQCQEFHLHFTLIAALLSSQYSHLAIVITGTIDQHCSTALGILISSSSGLSYFLPATSTPISTYQSQFQATSLYHLQITPHNSHHDFYHHRASHFWKRWRFPSNFRHLHLQHPKHLPHTHNWVRQPPVPPPILPSQLCRAARSFCTLVLSVLRASLQQAQVR